MIKLFFKLKIKSPYVFFIFLIVFAACKTKTNSNISKEEYSRPKGSYERNIKAIVSIRTYDHYNRLLEKGFGFYISSKTILTNLDLIKGSYKVKVAPVGTDEYLSVAGYTAVDLDKNLVLLKVQNENLNYLHLERAVNDIPDSVRTLYRVSRKMYAPKYAVGSLMRPDSFVVYPVKGRVRSGLPAFTYLHHLVGMVQNIKSTDADSSVLIPVSEFESLVKDKSEKPLSIYSLRNKTNKVYASYKTIKGFRIITTYGNIEIKLSNKTPLFRDNFIKLVSDHFYDSLLVHRVIKNFLIQTGAADSKYAKKDDVVGWQGPGYMLPTKVVPSLFHRRGAVAASKLPDSRNPKNKSDGSQFYIVSGRVFTDDELDDLEKEKNYHFTAEQRKVYTTIGGAPHLDGDYVVFGEVTKGMGVVDKIAAVKTYGEDRPVNDIRVLRIEMIKGR